MFSLSQILAAKLAIFVGDQGRRLFAWQGANLNIKTAAETTLEYENDNASKCFLHHLSAVLYIDMFPWPCIRHRCKW